MLTTTIMMTIITINVNIKKNKNNTNLRNPKHKSNLNNDDDNSVDRSINNAKKIHVFILGDGTVKDLNGYLITKAINHKSIVKVRQVQYMYDHVNPAGNCMFKVNNRNTRTRCEICSKLTIKTPERR